jgi:hypothetical protein
MHGRCYRPLRLALAGCLVFTPLACQAFKPGCGTDCEDGACPSPYLLHKVKVVEDPTVMALASDLDTLEHHIEWYGSVVPKVPDVWSQARLQKHREEFEARMAGELDKFEKNINGSLTRSDSAFFSQAIALGIAAQPRRTSNTTNTTNLTPPVTAIVTAGSTPAALTNTVTKKPDGTTVTETPAAVNALVVPDADLRTANGLKPKVNLPPDTISLEPTIFLEQKARYLNLLNQLRRTNEGDDTADAPGYSLNLVRIPVSILPGKKTAAGHGAEITFTLSPILSDELLPMTFRNLAVNDLVDQLGFPLARFLESPAAKDLLTDENREAIVVEEGRISGSPSGTNTGSDNAVTKAATAPKASQAWTTSGHGKYQSLPKQSAAATFAATLATFHQAAKKSFVIPTLAPNKGLLARSPFPNSEIIDVYGEAFCFEIAYQANQAFQKDIQLNNYAHLPDIQSFLLAEVNAAYRYLAESSNQSLWASYCTEALVTAVRNHDYATLARNRKEFRAHFEAVSSSHPASPTPVHPQKLSITSALAWCLLVESALLTDRLVLDMKETATAKGCACFCAKEGGWTDFYLPAPSPEARAAFNNYVKCRWPVRVFALDPVTQDQNIADELSTQRETQLALSLAFVSGKINANSMTRYARRLEAQYQTIALNRTQVGFSHGEDTFGWRFTPRFQTLPTEPNLTVLFRDQLLGGPGPDAVLRKRRLEPGPRECVAIVLMPSFVPYLTCDSVSNWYPLGCCLAHKKFDHTDAMRASRAVKMLQVHGPKVGDADCFRHGDFPRLLRRIDQLEARLPTQTSTVQVPILNTLGGFKMFNNGTTDLAPELYGFYGAPGIDPTRATTLFLVGDHFSPLRTEIIVGNGGVTEKTILSRQVVKITVPTGSLAVDGKFINVHLATPYGVTRDISVPVVPAKKDDTPKPTEGYKLDPAKLGVTYQQVAIPGGYILHFVRTSYDPVSIRDLPRVL